MQGSDGVRRTPRAGPLRPRGAPARRLTLLVTLSLALLLGGCAFGQPWEVGPTGVDGLAVPTASPDPDDFVPRIDNPWLPLSEGSRWRYEEVDGGAVVATVEVSVPGEVEEVAGVSATVVRTVVTGRRGDVIRESDAWLAQDGSGNVWWFGESVTDRTGRRTSAEESWRAGTAGAAAGLAIPAEPRRGDGFVLAAAPGIAEERARVVDAAAGPTAPVGTRDGLLQIEVTTPLDDSLLEQRFFERGIGLVREERVTGPRSGTALVLVEHVPAPA